MKVGVVDYGVGNLGSIMRALDELRVEPVAVDRAIDLHATDCLILPGVGNFADCASLLEAGGWASALRDEVLGYGRPLLGICVGMQLLADTSTEGADAHGLPGTRGLGLVPGRVEHLRELGCTLRVPHVGWNAVTRTPHAGHLLDGIPDGTDYYFVHSYAFVAGHAEDVLATTSYGASISAAVRHGHVWGTQFHPEKSSRAGFRLLRNFIAGPEC